MKKTKKKTEAKPPEELVTMTGTKSQFQLAIRALDFYSRILAGQWNEIESVFRMNYPLGKVNYDQIRNVTKILDAAKCVLMPELTDHSSFGITNKDLAVDARASYELRKWIENYLVRDIPDSHCAGDPPLRVTEQSKLEFRDPVVEREEFARMFNMVSSMASVLGAAGHAVDHCSACGCVYGKGSRHECKGLKPKKT